MRDCYVDVINRVEQAAADELLFKLNIFEIDRESFKLAQELLMTKITEARLSEEYVSDLVFRPMTTAIDVAERDLELALEELAVLRQRYEAGEVTLIEVRRGEIAVEEKRVVFNRARADLTQREIEIEGQRRRLKAEQSDYADRLKLNTKIQEMHQFVSLRKCRVTWHTWQGAFVEEGDPICTLDYGLGALRSPS